MKRREIIEVGIIENINKTRAEVWPNAITIRIIITALNIGVITTPVSRAETEAAVAGARRRMETAPEVALVVV